MTHRPSTKPPGNPPLGFGGVAALVLGLLASPSPNAAAVHRLSAAGQAFTNAGFIRISPDHRYAVYTQDLDADDAFELFSVPLVGGAPRRLSSLLSIARVQDFQITPDSTRVVFQSDQETPGRWELYSSPIYPAVNGAWTKLSFSPSVESVEDWSLSPDGASLDFIGRPILMTGRSVWRVPVVGPPSAAFRLTPQTTPDSDVVSFAVTPNGARILYVGDLVTGSNDLFSRSTGGGTATQLNPVTHTDIKDLISVSPDSTRVAFYAHAATGPETYVAAVGGATGSAVRVSGAVAATVGPNLDRIQFTADSAYLLYRLDQLQNEVSELFSAPVAGGEGSAQRISGNQALNGDVFTWRLSSDGSFVIYCADQLADNKFELFRVPVDGSATAQRVTPLLGNDRDVFVEFRLSPDGSALYFVADLEIDGSFELFGIASDGSGAYWDLSNDLTGNWFISEHELSGGSSFYVNYQMAQNEAAVWHRPSDGSGQPFLISGSPVNRAHDMEIVDAGRVTFAQDVNGVPPEAVYIGDLCLLCDGFESAGTSWWSAAVP